MSTSKSYKVHISGEQYTVVSDEHEEHIKQAAALVDEYMKEIAVAAPSLDAKKIAILAALRIANSLLLHEERIKIYTAQEHDLVMYLNNELLSLNS